MKDIVSVRFCFLLLTFILICIQGTEAFKEEDETGSRMYKDRCAWCHGDEGRGDGPASEFLRPLPRDFSKGIYKFISSDYNSAPLDGDIYRAISNGIPGTAMPSWKKKLTSDEIWGLVRYVKGFSENLSNIKDSQILKHGTPIPFSRTSVETGKIIFNKALCYECHGKVGRGDGTRRLKDERGDRVWQRDLTMPASFKGGSAPEDIFFRISNGIPGTPMPGFGKKNLLTEKERWHLVNYVLSLSEGTREKGNKEHLSSAFTGGSLPTETNDPEWDRLTGTLIPLSPNTASKKRLFKPTNESLNIKSLYNRGGVTFLLSWRDRTRSLPTGAASEILSEGTPLEDGVAIQFPVVPSAFSMKPFLGHGEPSSSVRTIYWGAGAPETAKTFHGTGYKSSLVKDERSLVTTKATYFKGEWKVVFYCTFKKNEVLKKKFWAGKSFPVAFANWDGSNAERGSRHTFTAWHPLVLERKGDRTPFFIAIAVFMVFSVLQKLISTKIKKGQLSKNVFEITNRGVKSE